jgi:UDP-N-acetylmuramate--L-alanine ligase
LRKRDEIAAAFDSADALDGRESFFLVGIGGAGMSALARMLRHRGFQVRGTDSTRSPETDRLQEEGIDVRLGHSGEGLTEDQALVVTDAIDLDRSPEVARARELGVPIVRRSQALGWLLRTYRLIAVTGTHGKTTTTGMLGAAMVEAGMNPLVVVGAAIPDWGGPVREGDGEWAVVEACEAYDSFHDLQPEIVLLTNLELDHVDFHGTYENLRDSVVRFVSKVPEKGWLVYASEDRGAAEVAEHAAVRAMGYGIDEVWQRQMLNQLGVRPKEIRFFGDRPALALPGRHNLMNATGALMAAALAGADVDLASGGIAKFRGAERRLQVLRDDEIAVVDDYAHHPTEIAASLRALRDRYPGRRLVVAYQPHLYSRTAPLIDEFAQALEEADLVVLTDIYPAREDPIPGVSSARIAEKVRKPVRYVPSRHLLPMKVARLLREGDVVVGMGAGNIAEFAPALVRELDRGAPSPDGPLRVAVIYGGDNAEREVSILSGREIHAALCRLGHHSRMLDVSETLLSGGDLQALVGPDRPDVAFLAVHGTHMEGGATQGLLELLHVPYTGSGPLPSAVAMDKERTKEILRLHGARVPEGVLLRSPDEPVPLELPLVVKPNEGGSTVGLAFVERAEELRPAIERAFAYDSSVLVEEWIRGVELSVPVLIDEALPPVEIVPASGQYDFASKYVPGATEEIVPARVPEEVREEARRLALLAHRVLGCSGATRTDMMVRDGEIFVLELNTLPGMTGTSLLPASAAAAGITFDALCQRLLEDALVRHAQKA